MNIASWKLKWKEIFLTSLETLPTDNTLSFSGGFDSSIILYGLLELGRKPDYCITFKLDGYESKDWYYTEKACKIYKIPLIVTNIPKLPKYELVEDIRSIIPILGNTRPIDVQCGYVFKNMVKDIPTKNLTLGFHNSALYNSGKANAICYGNYKKNKISEEEYREFYLNRRNKFLNPRNNHFVLRTFIEHFGISTHSPYLDAELINFSHKHLFHEYHYTEHGTAFSKYFLYQIFQSFFERVGNKKNKKDMHVESKVKEYFIETLLTNDHRYKSLPGVLNHIGKGLYEIN